VASVKVSIQDTTVGGSSCWNGSSFTAACPNYVTATGTTSWSYNLAAGSLTDGHNYTATVQTTDALTNADNAAATASWIYDTTNPGNAITIASVGAGNALLSGTTLYYRGAAAGNFTLQDAVSDGGAGPASAQFPALGGTTTGWTHTGQTVSTPLGGPYVSSNFTWSASTTSSPTEGVVGSDAAGNTATTTLTFVDDSAAPTAAVTFPTAAAYNAAGWNGALTGTSSDGGAGVQTVKVSIQDTTVGGSSCWNGSSFTAACPNYVTATGTTSWSYSLAAGNLTDGHSYTATVQTIDALTNTDNAAATATWTYDTSAPSSATLTTNAVYNAAGWPGSVSGTVSDAGTGSHGISAVNVSIQDSGTGKCWNGANFTTASCPNYVPVSSGGTASGGADANWSYTLASSALTDGHTYTVQIQATDATVSGNTSGDLSAGTFVYDTSAPTAATLTTNGAYNAAGWPGAVSGTANDAATGAHGISAVSISVEDSGTGKCWNGSDFTTASCPNYVAVTSGGSASGAADAGWSYSLVTGALTDGDTYTVKVRATDATTSGNQSGDLSVGTFDYDASAPSSATLTTNGNYNAAGWPGHVDGTVSDSGTGGDGISAVSVSIQDSVSGKCWNGSDFTTASCPNYVAVTSGGTASGAANASWSYNLASGTLTDGHTYTVLVRATDATTTGNTSGDLSAGTFTYDTAAPGSATLDESGAYNAAGWPGAISGTASDTGTGSHGISSVNVSIADSGTGKCWNGTNFTTASCPNYVAVTSGGTASGASNANWSYTIASSALTDGDTYTVQVQATDATTSGNTSGDLTAGTFVYDTSAPTTATLTTNGAYNAAGWPGAVSGTASDAGTGANGISAVSVSIQDSGTGKCWNGSDFTTASCPNYVPVSSGGTASGGANANWSYTLASSALTDGDTYTVKVRATDATTSGNQSGDLSAGTFDYDTSAPTAATLGTNGAYSFAGWPGAVSGTASDAGAGSHGISAVKVSIQDSGTGKCWNGTDFTTVSCPNYVPVSSGGTASGASNANWSYTIANTALTDGDTYTVTVQAKDATTSGNTSGDLAVGSFDYDTSAPGSATLTTNGAYNAAGWPGAISGTASDAGNGSHGISAVEVSIQDSVSGDCWNGSDFTTASCPNYLPVTSGGTASGGADANWSYTLAGGALDDGHTYTVSVQATDGTTTGTTSGDLTAGSFDYDTSAPTTATLTTNGAYNTAGWPGAISGTANDTATGAHGISAVSVSIEDSVSGKCWNGSDFTTATCPNYVPVTSGGTASDIANAHWSYTLASGALTDGHTYAVLVQATDATDSGNTSGDLSVGTFRYDTAAPASATLATNGVYNPTGWPGAVSGTVSDAGTGSHGISAVGVSIEDSSSGKCWNGSDFTTTSCPNYVPVTSGGTASGGADANWSYDLVTGALTDGDTYTVTIQATDATTNGNVSGDLAAGTFVYDSSAPSSATLTTNGAYNTAGWPGAISGTVSDAGTGSHGISSVDVSIEDSTTGNCWNGSDFTTASCPNYVPVSSGGTASGGADAGWSYTLASSALTDGDAYTVTVLATDATTSGNTSDDLSAGSFDYDTSAPSAATLAQSGAYNAAGWPGAVSGTVSDAATGSHGISAVDVSIQDSVSGKCWNGSDFTTASCPNYVAVTSGGTASGGANANWSYTLANSALTDGHTYTVQIRATDATTNGNTSGDLSAGTFDYDTSSPAGTIAFPADGARYDASGWTGTVSGTATDAGAGSHGIASTEVSIQEDGGGNSCWDGTNAAGHFGASCPNWVTVANGTASGAATANWNATLGSSALVDGSTYVVTLRTTDATTSGNQNASAATSTFVYDTSAPTLSTAATNAAGTTLTLTYDEPLDSGSVPAAGDFVLEYQPANGGAWTGESITGVSVVGSTVVLSLATPPNDSQAVRISYAPGTSPIRDVAANDAASLTHQAVTNGTTDTVAPSVTSMATNVAGTQLTVDYDEPLDSGSTPAAGDFVLEYQPSGGGAWTPQSISGVSVSGSIVTLTLASPPDDSQSVRLSYTPGTNPTRDASSSHNDAAAFSQQSVTNDTPDTVAPTVANLSASDANGSYTTGSTIHVTVAFSEPVLVTGSPKLALNTTPAESATYASGSGTKTLEFDYTVQAGDTSADLDYAATTSLTLNGGSIRDAASNDADRTLAPPGAAGSLGANKDIVVDTTAPTVTNVTASNANGSYNAGTTIHVQVTFTEPATVTGSPKLALNTSPAESATYASGSGTSTLTFDYTVQAGDNSGALDYTGTGALTLNGGTIRDAATNDATLTLATPGTAGSLSANKSLVIDTIAPTVTNVTASNPDGSYTTGTVIHVQVGFSEPVTVTGSPALALNTGRDATYASGSGTSTLTFDYTVQAGDTSADLDYAATTSLTLNGGTIQDAATNDATLTLASPGAAGSLSANNNIVVDTTAPTVTNVTATNANGSYNAGTTIHVHVVFDEPVTVTGSPTLALNTGQDATYASGSGTSTLTFDYTVQAGDTSADLDYTATTSLTLNGGTIQDAATNDADLTLASPGAAGSLGANKNLVIDTTAPTVTNVSATNANGSYNAGTTIHVTIAFSEPVTVTGSPKLALDTTPARSATYASGSGGSTLTFDYTVQAGDTAATLDYVATTSLTLNGGTIQDAATNDATLTLASPGAAGSLSANKSITIDTTAPTVSNVTASNPDGSYDAGSTIHVQVVF
ncbi:MAG TPA: SwmB domain-containing protein, partial [Gaiellaceae bacterium]|nr:SwmB domain-containing protein [Gaiellaceae bacterium]